MTDLPALEESQEEPAVKVTLGLCHEQLGGVTTEMGMTGGGGCPGRPGICEGSLESKAGAVG